MLFKFNNVKISGISTVIPKKNICLLDEENLYGGDSDKLKRVIESSGFLNRRVTESDVMTSDLCLQASVYLFKNMNINKKDIDALIFVSYTPDYFMPATSYLLHHKLALKKDCIVMDIPQACSGYVIALYQASMLINAGCKKVLLLVGDSFSKFSDMFNNNTAPVFGDAGSATLVEYCEDAPTSYFNINSDSSGFDSLMCKNGAFRNPPTKDSFYEDGSFKYQSNMDGGKIFEFTMSEISPQIESLLNFSKLNKNQIDYFVLHQANKFILENISRKLDILMEKIPCDTMTKYGNQCGASIPCAISDMLQDIVTQNKNKMLLSGFGVGLSVASAIIDINKIYCSKINEYGV